jgi:uncharacterized protein (TIGR03000 family)
MYSMVLLAALTVAPDAAGFGRLGGCGGCNGAVVSVGCTGCYGTTSCFGSCYGSSCCGGSCYSSSCCGGRVGLFSGLRSRLGGLLGRGCSGSSCYSSSCYGSGCYSSSCYGSSCFGSSCGGAVVMPAYGCTGYAPTGFGSCHGGGAVYYGPDFHQGMMAPPVVGSGIIDGLGGVAPAVPTLTIDRSAEFRAAQATPEAVPARLTIELPASAKLYVDGRLVRGDSTTRNFHTPDLTPGKTFYYDLKAEVEVNGKTVFEDKRVLVKAGAANTESFEKLIAAVKADKTDVAKK